MVGTSPNVPMPTGAPEMESHQHDGVNAQCIQMPGSLHFSFFVLVDEVSKNENGLRDFLYDVFCLQGKTGKTKIENNNKLLHNIFIFPNFVNQNVKQKMG